MPRRTAGSVRYDTYYKIQLWQPHLLAWKDIQKAYQRLQDAKDAVPATGRWRIMSVSMRGRQPVTEGCSH